MPPATVAASPLAPAAPPRSAAGRVPDRITLDLVTGILQATRAEMEALIERTAMSPFIREKKDYFTAFLDREGRLVVSTSLTLAGNLVDAILEHYPRRTMRDGDLYWYNDCYASYGAVSHLPDMAFVMPVFHEGELIGFTETWGHLWDIGGHGPGERLSARDEHLPGRDHDPPGTGHARGGAQRGGVPDLRSELALSGHDAGRSQSHHGRLRFGQAASGGGRPALRHPGRARHLRPPARALGRRPCGGPWRRASRTAIMASGTSSTPTP